MYFNKLVSPSGCSVINRLLKEKDYGTAKRTFDMKHSRKTHRLKQLVIHIGTHKTGTSSFQNSMLKNAETLISHGVRPIRGPSFQNGKRGSFKKANHMHFAHLILRPEIRSGARVRGRVPILSDEQRQRQLDNLAQRLSNFEEEILLLSAEALCFLRSADEQALLRRFLKGVGREVRTLVVFRNEVD